MNTQQRSTHPLSSSYHHLSLSLSCLVFWLPIDWITDTLSFLTFFLLAEFSRLKRIPHIHNATNNFICSAGRFRHIQLSFSPRWCLRSGYSDDVQWSCRGIYAFSQSYVGDCLHYVGRQLCDRLYSNVSFVGAHNSYAVGVNNRTWTQRISTATYLTCLRSLCFSGYKPRPRR